ncbi:glutathione S-transferase family protein [Myxosarcina sp. GI1(2024)]
MYRVYGDMLSGNCYKVKLLLQWLGIQHEWIHVDILADETHTETFLSMNTNGKIPILDIGKGQYLWESNAILNFLAEGSPYLPASGLPRAKVLQWQFFEQYSHEPYIAVARYINKYLGLPDHLVEQYQSKQKGGHKALAVMEKQLSQSPFFVGSSPTIADISLFAYTHVAYEGGFSLERYPFIEQWISRIETLPNYVEMARENA